MSEVPEDRISALEELRQEALDYPDWYRSYIAEHPISDAPISYDSLIDKFCVVFEGHTMFFNEFDAAEDWYQLNTHRKHVASTVNVSDDS